MKTLRATFGKPNAKKPAEQPSAPMCGSGSLVAFERDENGKRVQVEAVTIRTYFNERGSGMQPVRACVWIRSPRGTGSSAYAEVFEAVARARGFKGPMLWVSHGL